jgi:hypothetical protein
MAHASHKFIYHFLLIFLIVLLCMFGMHYALVWLSANTDGTTDKVVFDLDNLFRVNLFVIDLCVLLIVESLLILLFCRFTLPSMGIACVAMVTFLSLRPPIENTQIITRVFSPFIANRYAFLETADAILLFAINTLMLAFLVTVLLKETEINPDSKIDETSKLSESKGTAEEQNKENKG